MNKVDLIWALIGKVEKKQTGDEGWEYIEDFIKGETYTFQVEGKKYTVETGGCGDDYAEIGIQGIGHKTKFGDNCWVKSDAEDFGETWAYSLYLSSYNLAKIEAVLETEEVF